MNMSELERFFANFRSRMELAKTNLPDAPSHLLVAQPELEQFFTAVSHRVELQRRLDKQKATRFNVFDLIEPDENKLSDVLARLLDPKGDHGQGDLFLRLLFKQLGLGSDTKLTKAVRVKREAPTHGILKYRRRMDVFVEAGVLLAIENKVDSLEQKDQVKNYLEHLRYCAKGSGKQSILIYLTPNGRWPECRDLAQSEESEAGGSLRCWSYQVELLEWLEACCEKCEARKIRDFLSNFIAYIESALKRELENNQEKEDNEN
jgi:hypothetical protein